MLEAGAGDGLPENNRKQTVYILLCDAALSHHGAHRELDFSVACRSIIHVRDRILAGSAGDMRLRRSGNSLEERLPAALWGDEKETRSAVRR